MLVSPKSLLSKNSLPKTHPRGAIAVIIIVLLLVASIGLAVWYTVWGKPKAEAPSASSSTAQNKAANTSNWKTETLKYEKLSFKYPADWKFVNRSEEPQKSVITEAKLKGPFEWFTLTAPSGLVMEYRTHLSGLGGTCGKKGATTQQDLLCPDVETIAADKIAGASDLYVVTSELRNTATKKPDSRSIVVISNFGVTKVPAVGIETNTFPYFPVFHAGGADKFADGNSYSSSFQVTTFYSVANAEQSKKYRDTFLKSDLSKQDFFAQSDWVTAKQILASITKTQ